MPRRWSSSCTLATLFTAASLALASGTPAPAGDAGSAIAKASDLIDSGQLVEARRDLSALRTLSLTPAQRERVDQLLSAAERRLDLEACSPASLPPDEGGTGGM